MKRSFDDEIQLIMPTKIDIPLRIIEMAAALLNLIMALRRYQMGNEIKEKEALEYKIQELKYHLKIAEHTVLEQKIQIEKAKKLKAGKCSF